MDQRRYIDPGNYLDLMELLSTFTTEIERSKTKLDRLIGQGKKCFFYILDEIFLLVCFFLCFIPYDRQLHIKIASKCELQER